MAQFPSPLERFVASSLVLLASTPPKFCLDDRERATAMQRSKNETFRGSLISGDSSKSCSSVITASDASREEIRARKIRILALAAFRREKMKHKVVRRSRSKTQTTWKAISESSTTASLGSVNAESSCVSSNSSAASSARSRSQSRHVSHSGWYNYKLAMVVRDREQQMKMKRSIGSAHMRHQAESILKLLSGVGWLSEMKIRQILGDSPDTSKALRMLLTLKKVKRSGLGGRGNPFTYTIA